MRPRTRVHHRERIPCAQAGAAHLQRSRWQCAVESGIVVGLTRSLHQKHAKHTKSEPLPLEKHLTHNVKQARPSVRTPPLSGPTCLCFCSVRVLTGTYRYIFCLKYPLHSFRTPSRDPQNHSSSRDDYSILVTTSLSHTTNE